MDEGQASLLLLVCERDRSSTTTTITTTMMTRLHQRGGLERPRGRVAHDGSSQLSCTRRSPRHAACGGSGRNLQRHGRGPPVLRATEASTAMPASLKGLVAAFSAVPDPMLRYKQLLHFAEKLEPLAPEHQTPENKVEGCVSQVWVKGFLQDDGTVTYKAESDSQLTKGLAALLVKGLSGATPEAITSLQPSFIEMLGLQQSLTPSRNNGFLNMLLKMQKIAHGLASDGDAPMSRRIEEKLVSSFSPTR